MNLTSRLQELRRKHEALSQEVEVAQRSPGTADHVITDLKKRKLVLKEEIERLAHA